MGFVAREIGESQRGCEVEHAVRSEVLKRLNYIEGHLEGIRRMVENDKYCPDILKQTFAVRRAIEKMEAIMLDGHLHHCVVEGIRNGREEQVIQELMELYTQAHR